MPQRHPSHPLTAFSEIEPQNEQPLNLQELLAMDSIRPIRTVVSSGRRQFRCGNQAVEVVEMVAHLVGEMDVE